MKNEFKENRVKALKLTAEEYLKIGDEYFDKADAISPENFTKFLGVTKIISIDRSSDFVFIIYEDDAEDEECYRKVEVGYRLTDAENALIDYFGGDSDYSQIPDEEKEKFKTEFGFSLYELFDIESKNYILGDLVDFFFDNQDCNVGENITWENAINEVLRGIRRV